MYAVEALHTDDRQNSETTDNKHFLFLSDSCLYIVHLGLGLFSGSCKKSGNIGKLRKKHKFFQPKAFLWLEKLISPLRWLKHIQLNFVKIQAKIP